jgi:SAM-dependent methyltransferase
MAVQQVPVQAAAVQWLNNIKFIKEPMSTEYLETTKNVYREAAENPQIGLCCTTTPVWQLPGLDIPKRMLEMNYGCGSTVHPRDLVNDPKILYVGVGGGMELLQFAYFSRQQGGVTGIDVVDEMLDASRKNFAEAEKLNPWFRNEFVELRNGDALNLPVDDNSIDVAAQNCLFNIFKEDELKQALKEMYRVLKPHGRLVLSDPTCETLMPDGLKEDERLRALCLSGALPLKDYIKMITDIGFGTVEIRAKRPYRILDPKHYATDKLIFIESVEVCAIKDPMPDDGPCVFTGKTAIYFGNEDFFDDHKGHVLMPNQPLAVCDKTGGNLAALQREDIYISESTWFYDGGGCC